MKKFFLLLVFLFFSFPFWITPKIFAANCNECPGGRKPALCTAFGGEIEAVCARFKSPAGGCLDTVPLPSNPCPDPNVPGLGCPDPLAYVRSAIGCIPTAVDKFVPWLLTRLLGISGGLAFLLVIVGSFKLMTSAGDPKGIQSANETITSALIGLLFIIFSVFLLKLIGVEILSIPQLGQ